MPIDQQKLLAALEAARENSYGTDQHSELEAKRAKAIDAYLGLNTNPAPEGRSQVVDRSVYETISTLMPSLIRIFASSSESICKVLPVGPDDEAAAEQATGVLNNVVTEQNPWEQILGDWLLDAALLNNGYAMAYWDTSKRMVRERYEGQSDDQMAALMQDKEVRVVEHSQMPDEQGNADAAAQYQMIVQQWQQAAQMAQMQGLPVPMQPPQPQPMFLHDLVIERAENVGKVCIKVLPPEHCFVSADTPDWMLRDCPYFEFRREMSLGDVRAMGFDVPDDISDDEDGDSEEDRSRNRFAEWASEGDEKGLRRRVWVRMCWIRCDCEDDGEERLYQAILIGRTVLYAEPVARIPVSSITFQPMPHRHIGMSLAETSMDIQDVKTAVIRGGLDNLYLANNGRHAISSKVNLADFLDARPGGVVRMIDGSLPGDGHIMPLVHPMAFEQIIGSLEYFDQMRQNRTGASRYFSGTDAGAINRTASGTIALQNMASMRVEHLARVVAPGIEELFSIVQEAVAKHENKAQTIKMRGQWVNVDPQAWRKKRDVRISVGVGAGNKESLMQQLGMTFGAQMQLMPFGLAGPQEVYQTVLEMSKLAGYANPQKFWTDPSGKPPWQPPPSPEQIKAQTEQQRLQFEAQQDAMKFQAEKQFEREKAQMQAELDRNREEMDARQKQLEAEQKAQLEAQKASLNAELEARKLEFEKWKAELDAAVKLQIAGMNDSMSRDLAKPQEDTRVNQVLEMMEEMREEYESPAELVRGADGRAVGVKRGKRVRRVIRDENGRAVGLQ